MFVTVYEYFCGPSTESTPLGSTIRLFEAFKSSGPFSPSGGKSGSGRSPLTGNKYICEWGSGPSIGPNCKNTYVPSTLHHKLHDAQTSAGLPPPFGYSTVR